MITLKKFERTDFQQLLDWIESPRFLMQWSGTAFSYPLNQAQLAKHLEETKVENPKRLAFKAVNNEGKMDGYIELNNIDLDNHKTATVSRVLVNPHNRGKGTGEAMVRKVARIGFEELHLHRLELRVFDFNKGAIACYEKAGFHQEGVLRDYRKFENEYWNTIVMSMLESEWEGKCSNEK